MDMERIESPLLSTGDVAAAGLIESGRAGLIVNSWPTSCVRDDRGRPEHPGHRSRWALATFDEDELPDVATASIEVDYAYSDDPTEDKAGAVDGAIGELSPFHEMNGVYAQGVSVRLEVWGHRGSLRATVSSVTRSVTKTERDGAARAVTNETLRPG